NTLWQGPQGGSVGQHLLFGGLGTLDLNGNSQMVGRFNYQTGFNQEGRITSAAPATFVANPNGEYFGGVISGSIAFNANLSSGALTLGSANTYSGPTIITGKNTLTLRDAGALTNTSALDINYANLTLDNGSASQMNLNDRINDAATVTMRGSLLQFNGRDNTNTFEKLGVVALAEGLNYIYETNGGGAVRSTVLSIGTLVANPDASLIFSTGLNGQLGSNMRVVTGNGAGFLVNGVIPWAVAGGGFLSYAPSDAAGLSGGLAPLESVGFPGYDGTVPSANLSTQNIKLASGSYTFAALGNASVGGTYALNSLAVIRSASGQNLSFANNNDTLNLTSGGLFMNGGSGSNFTGSVGSQSGNGILTAGGTQ
ncbi:MAG: hypothetical protein ORN83_01000, partial [Chthoniobacteraceae bacterium]|nr:hypothetical protein [Chthoniobacteraceae bacterium]